MKHLRTIASAAALLAGCSAAMAADLSTKDTGNSGALALPSSWSGLYVEAGVGPGFAQTRVANIVTLSEKGTEATARIGYDYRLQGTRFAVGVFGDVSNSFDVNGSIGNVIKLGNQWQYSVGGRLAYDHGSGQIYALAAGAWEGFNVASSSSTLTGFKYGGGVNVKIAGPWYAGLELTQTDWGNFTVQPLHLAVKNTDDAVRVFTGVSF